MMPDEVTNTAAPSEPVNPAPTAEEINAAVAKSAAEGTLVGMAEAAGLVQKPDPEPEVDGAASVDWATLVEARLEVLEARLEAVESNLATALKNLAHVLHADFKAVWDKVAKFAPFKI